MLVRAHIQHTRFIYNVNITQVRVLGGVRLWFFYVMQLKFLVLDIPQVWQLFDKLMHFLHFL